MRSYSQRLDCLELNPYVFFMKVIFIVFMFRDVPECSVFLVLSTPLSSDLYLPSTVTERFLTVPIIHLNLSWYPHSLNGLVRLIGANFRTNDFCYLVK